MKGVLTGGLGESSNKLFDLVRAAAKVRERKTKVSTICSKISLQCERKQLDQPDTQGDEHNRWIQHSTHFFLSEKCPQKSASPLPDINNTAFNVLS